MTKTSLFWHDYETWGINPRKDRASQFAGIRTNLELEIIDEPVTVSYTHLTLPTTPYV